MKKRLDVLLVERGLATSREKAKAMIMAGEVLVDNEREDKARFHVPGRSGDCLKRKTTAVCEPRRLKIRESNEKL